MHVIIDGVRYVPAPMVDENRTLAKLFAESRQLLRLTYKAAGALAGLSPSTVFSVEVNDYLPKLDATLRLARAYGLGADQVFAAALRSVDGCTLCGSLDHNTTNCPWNADSNPKAEVIALYRGAQQAGAVSVPVELLQAVCSMVPEKMKAARKELRALLSNTAQQKEG